jgi:hypothetical protein
VRGVKVLLQHIQQITYDSNSLIQQLDSLIDLEVLSDGVVKRLKIRLAPEYLWRVYTLFKLAHTQHIANQIDIDPHDEQLSDFLINGLATHVDFTSLAQHTWNMPEG